MNNTTLIIKEKLKNKIEHQDLSFSEIEKGAGITRGSLRNFMNGTVKEPKLEIILAVANFLKLDINDMLSNNSSQTEALSEKTSRELGLLDEKLLADCATGLADYVGRKKISVTLDDAIQIIKKTYNYSVRNNNGKFDRCFLEWSLDDLTA